jgi:hypothetical protein
MGLRIKEMQKIKSTPEGILKPYQGPLKPLPGHPKGKTDDTELLQQ